jgi:hypothetical protein
MSVQNNMVIDVAVLCHEYTELKKMCDDHIINLDDICISKDIFRKIFYFYGENFGMDKKIVNTEELLHYVSFLPKHRKIEREKFYLLEHILRNIEDDLGVSRNCFTPETRVQLTSEINSLNSLCDMNCCSVLASLTWSNLLNIIDKYRFIKEEQPGFVPICAVSVVFKTPTPNVKNTIIRFNYRITDF